VTDFDDAVVALCRNVQGGPPLKAQTLALVRGGLIRQLQRSHPGIKDLIDDLVDEAICRLLEQTIEGVIRLDDHPGGYLRVSADRLALQWRRRAEVRRRALDPVGEAATPLGAAGDFDPITQLVGRLSDIADVERALDAAMDVHDDHATKVLQVYIDHAARLEDWPLLADVAADAGVSQPTVRAVLRYTRQFLIDGHDTWRRVRAPS
jgi:DNA-directed RNA polymerase specialized sigma24 family protein